jgi:hypothetical protein
VKKKRADRNRKYYYNLYIGKKRIVNCEKKKTVERKARAAQHLLRK